MHNETLTAATESDINQDRPESSARRSRLLVSIGDRGGDKRDYRVSFDKINSKLPGFKCEWTVQRGAEQLLDIFSRIGLTMELFESAPHTRLKQITNLIETKQIDADFFWRA